MAQSYPGGYNAAAFAADFELVNRGELQQVGIIELDVAAVGKEQQLQIPMACNSFALISGVADESGIVQRSSTVAVVALRFNDRNQKAMLFSRVANSGDLKTFNGAIVKVYARVVTAEVGAKLYFACFLAAGVADIVSAQGYNPPTGGSPPGGVGPT